MQRVFRFGLCTSLLILVGACAGVFTAEGNIEAARKTGPPSDAFNAALQQEYLELAQTEFDEFDYRDADRYAPKALAAGNGESVQPFDPGDWDVSETKAAELYDARQQLLLALDNNGRTKAPGDAAHAQAMFDCWVEEEDEGHEPDAIAACRDAFWDALARVQAALEEPEPAVEEPPPPPPPEPPARDYLVFFDFDKTDIRAHDATILDRVVQAMSELESRSVTLTGHTDRAGPAEYNQGLSDRRAFAVRDYLMSKGITSGISTSGKGETDPRIPTPDDWREAENRRVEIRIS